MALDASQSLLRDVAVCATLASSAKDELERAVIRAREHGVSWERIAEALGVKRQSAMARYAKLPQLQGL